MIHKLISLPFVALAATALTASAQKVQLGDLTIEGVTLEDTLGRRAHAYFSIPFAEPPVGPLRFLDPVPKEYSKGTMDATQRGPACVQDASMFSPDKGGTFWPSILWNFMLDSFPMSEDCLHLSVYTPATPAVDNKPRPVLFFIHGGGFTMGSVREYDGRVLANEADAVVVMIQYRLGMFGFYSTGAGGNWGLKDQTLALEWVKENIAVFGGDPNSVTIFGESAGSISVGMHSISPLSKGLFHRGILHSGTELMAAMYNFNPLASAKFMGQEFGCPVDDNDKLTECLRSKTAEELNAKLQAISQEHMAKVAEGKANMMEQAVSFFPTVDGQFFDENPLAGAKSNPVDLVVGFNNDEFGFMMGDMMGLLGDMTDEGLAAALKGMAGMMSQGNAKYTEKLYSAIAAVYLRTHMTPHENARAMQQFMADSTFVGPSYSKADKHVAAGQKVFMYRLDNGPAFQKNPGAYVDADKLGHAIPAIAIRPHDVGGDHGDDMYYTFGLAFMPQVVDKGVSFTKAEKELSTRMMRDWGNFARGQDPWSPYAPAKRNMQILDHISPVREAEHLQPAVVKFWTETLPGIMAEMMGEMMAQPTLNKSNPEL